MTEILARSSGTATAPRPPGGDDLVATTLAALAVPPTAVVRIPGGPGTTAAWPAWVDPRVRQAIERQGITRLWRHQVIAAESLRAGRHVVIATGTASGKSLGYWLPALTAAVAERATALYCTPTKALGQDQRARLAALDLPHVNPACYDGDTDQALRPWIRRSSRFVLTNPDMLHRNILPRHPQWHAFLARLRYVLLDEGHMYRGIFGSNVAAVVARLRRLCHAAGSDPTFVVSSATLGSPQASAAQLLGLPESQLVAITQDESRRADRTVILVDPTTPPGDPPEPESAGQHQPTAFGETAAVLSRWARSGVQSVGFLRSRAGVEAMAQQVRATSPDLPADSVTAYRGGLLPEERRDIEHRLRAGRLRCVAATNALELGVDIAGLDAVAMCGWPGTRLSFLQQLGRAGRAGTPAVAVLAAQADPLDRYYVHHPDRILGAGAEATVCDPGNPFVLLGHVATAIQELPLSDDEGIATFGPLFAELANVLAARSLIRRRGDRWYWVARDPAHSLADLRGNSQPVSIIESGTGRVMGTVDGASAPAQLHPGAVYTHLGVTHLVESLDLESSVAVAVRAQPGYTTVAQSVSDLRVVRQLTSRPLGPGTLHFGDVDVTSQVVGFLRRHAATGRVLGSEPLEMPARNLRTKSVWWCLSDPALLRAGLSPRTVPGSAHAAEHGAIGVLPALASCDRWDIGGLSTALHPDTGQSTVFVYDGHPGGAGFARRAYDRAPEWLAATRHVIVTCDCRAGCPGCVQSPKCGNGNDPLDKQGALAMLAALLGG